MLPILSECIQILPVYETVVDIQHHTLKTFVDRTLIIP